MKIEDLLQFYSTCSEVVGDIKKIVSRKRLNVYTGFEVSGEPHLGSLTALKRVCSFQKVTDREIKTTLLQADFHTFLNRKDFFKYEVCFRNFLEKYNTPLQRYPEGFCLKERFQDTNKKNSILKSG